MEIIDRREVGDGDGAEPAAYLLVGCLMLVGANERLWYPRKGV